MKKIVFFNIPALGHTNPTLPIVKKLVDMGNTVYYFSYDALKDKIINTGAEYISCDNIYEVKKENDINRKIVTNIAFSINLLVNITLEYDKYIINKIKEINPHCIVGDSMALWAKLLALKLNIPFICSTTTFAFNKHSAKIMKNSFKDVFRMIIDMPKINKDILRLKETGYPVQNITDIIGSKNDTETIVYTSEQFQPCADTFSDKYSFVGPIIEKSQTFVSKGSNPLIYISLGTVNNNKFSIFKKFIKAFKDTPYDVIISCGNSIDISLFEDIPKNISIKPSVDQIAVLEKANVFISHGGMNSVSESIYMGVPLILIPFTNEQTGVTKRVCDLNAGIKLNKLDKQTIIKSVYEILNNKKYQDNVNIISQGFKRSSGIDGAINKILSLCK